MAKKKNSTNSKDLISLMILAGVGVGGYFIWKKYFKKPEPEKKGFIYVSGTLPTKAEIGKIVTLDIFGKNNTEEDYLCFMQITNQETGEILAPMQSVQVEAGKSKEFSFEFMMPDENLRVEIQTGRIIDDKQTIDNKYPFTIQAIIPELKMLITKHLAEVV